MNPHNNEIVETIKVGSKPGRLAIGEGGVWTLNRGDGTVTRVDPATNKVVATIAVGDGAASGEIAAGLGSIWVSLAGARLFVSIRAPTVPRSASTALAAERYSSRTERCG